MRSLPAKYVTAACPSGADDDSIRCQDYEGGSRLYPEPRIGKLPQEQLEEGSSVGSSHSAKTAANMNTAPTLVGLPQGLVRRVIPPAPHGDRPLPPWRPPRVTASKFIQSFRLPGSFR